MCSGLCIGMPLDMCMGTCMELKGMRMNMFMEMRVYVS